MTVGPDTVIGSGLAGSLHTCVNINPSRKPAHTYRSEERRVGSNGANIANLARSPQTFRLNLIEHMRMMVGPVGEIGSGLNSNFNLSRKHEHTYAFSV